MKYLLTSLILLISLSIHSQEKINADDLKLIIGNWEGSLTYLDYKSGKPYTMPANLIVEAGKNENSLTLKNIYPNEPKANGSSKIKVTKNGTLLNKELVTSRKELKNGDLEIQTQFSGKDDNKKALIRNTYLFGKKVFSTRKDVQFEDSEDWIKRSEFSYARKG